MRRLIALSSLLLIGAAPPSPDAKLRAIVAPVSAARMKATVEKLVSFGTRHTLSSQTDPKRGIGAALRVGRGPGRLSGFGGVNSLLEVGRGAEADMGLNLPLVGVEHIALPFARSEAGTADEMVNAAKHGYAS